MKAMIIILAIYVALDIISAIVIVCRAKKYGMGIRTLSRMFKDFWKGKFRNYDTMYADAVKYENEFGGYDADSEGSDYDEERAAALDSMVD